MQSTADAATSSPSIDRLLAYENAELIARLQNELGIGRVEALALFDDTRRFLYLCGTMPPPLTPVRAAETRRSNASLPVSISS